MSVDGNLLPQGSLGEVVVKGANVIDGYENNPEANATALVKLWGNLAFNPISALTGATLEQICQYPLTRELARQMMSEAQAIAEKLGISFGITLEQRIDGAEKVGAHKTSMLQDIEVGRPTEIDAIVGAVAELGKLTQSPTPHIDAVYASVKLLETTLRY